MWGVGTFQPEPGLLGFRDERYALGMTGQQKRKPRGAPHLHPRAPNHGPPYAGEWAKKS